VRGGLSHNSSLQSSMNGSLNGIYDKPPKAGISALKFGSRNFNNNIVNSNAFTSKSANVPPPAPLPDSTVSNSFGILNSATGGGGLSRAPGMNLGRHQI
jgi:hypothetical protein